MQREELLQAIRDRNAVYRTCRTVAEENQDLAQEVDRLRLQLHRLEQDALLGSQPLARPAGDAGALRNDALRLSPLLWPRLAFGAVQRLSTSDSADFCRAVEAVCACAKDHCSAADAGVYSGDGDSVRAVQVAVTGVHVRDVAVSSPARQADCEGTGDAVSTLARRDSMSRGGYTDRMMTLEDVVSHFATSIVQGMLAMDGRVDLGRLRAHEESFRRMLLDVCWHSASSALAVSKELAEQDRKRAVSMPPNMRTLMSEELVETHEKLALAEKAVFSSQAELLDAYRQLASSGKETATLRKQLVALQGESFKAHKELNEEVSYFRQVQEENRVQAAILKSHGPQLQQLSNEIRALKEARVALHRKVCDLEDLVLVMQEGQVAQAKSFVTLSNVARTAADRLNVVMDKRCRETCSLESLLSLALTAPPPSPGELQDDDDQYSYQHTPKDEEQEGGQGSSRRAGLVLNTAQDGMEGWAREALEEAAADLRRIVHDVGNEYGSEARVLEMLVEGLEPQVAHHMAILQKLQAPHGAAAATLARVLADKDGRHARLLAAEAAAQNAHVSHHHTPSAGQAVPLQRREHRSISLDCQPGPKTSGDVRGGTLFGRANLDSPGNAGGIGMSFSTGTDGCFYITGLRLGSPAALCGLLQMGDMVTRVGGMVLKGGVNATFHASTSSSSRLVQADVANLLRGPVGSILTMHVRRRVRKAGSSHTAPSRSARPSSVGVSPMPALSRNDSANEKSPEHEITWGATDDDNMEVEGLEVEVVLTRVGLTTLPPSPSSPPSGGRRTFGSRSPASASTADSNSKRLSWNSLGATSK